MIDRNDIDGSAAEYVLGTLSREERSEVAGLRSSIADLDLAILAWESRLAPLNEATPAILPSTGLYPKIEQRLFALPASEPTRPVALMESRVRTWRTLALAASLAFIIVLSVLISGVVSTATAPQFIALLQKDATTPAFVVSLNGKTATLTMRALASQPPADKSYELWMIAEGEKTPRSLGVMPDQESKSVALKGIDPATLSRATLAISVEPLGGSPTSAPTGPVILTGKFIEASL